MPTVLLDTGPFAMLLMDSPRLTLTAREAIASSDRVLVSSISFYEIAQKTRLGKWPEMDELVHDLEAGAVATGLEIVPLMASLSLKVAYLDWDHRDPFDRIIAATALSEGVPCVSPDRAFDAIGVERVWG